MNEFKERFADCTSEYLLEKRALGEHLSDEAHKAIEEIFAERGERLPPKPSSSIDIAEVRKGDTTERNTWAGAGLIFLLLFGISTAGVIGKLIVKEFSFGHLLIVVAPFLLYYIYSKWSELQKRSTLTDAERIREDGIAAAEQNGMSEIMVCAAEGNIGRAIELVSFGANLDRRDNSGATALMYAAKNGHKEIVSLLLANGADPKIKSDKGSLAVDFAKRAGYSEIAQMLS
jgi:hypothetical protein